MFLLPREREGATLEFIASGYTAELFVGGEGLRAGVFTHSLRAGIVSPFHLFRDKQFFCVVRCFVCFLRGFLCFVCWFVSLPGFPFVI